MDEQTKDRIADKWSVSSTMKVVGTVGAVLATLGGGSAVLVTEAELAKELTRIDANMKQIEATMDNRYETSRKLVSYFSVCADLHGVTNQLQQMELEWSCSDVDSCKPRMGQVEYKVYSDLKKQETDLDQRRVTLSNGVQDILEGMK